MGEDRDVFEEFSERAKRVIFLTRLSAGRRGADAPERDDLIRALVREDQGQVGTFFPPGAVLSEMAPHRSFLSAEAASIILTAMAGVIAKREPKPDSEDMPVSDELGRTFASATAIRDELGGKDVEPLHLLAAVLSGEPSAATEAVKQVGISKESVIAAIKTGEQGK